MSIGPEEGGGQSGRLPLRRTAISVLSSNVPSGAQHALLHELDDAFHAPLEGLRALRRLDVPQCLAPQSVRSAKNVSTPPSVASRAASNSSGGCGSGGCSSRSIAISTVSPSASEAASRTRPSRKSRYSPPPRGTSVVANSTSFASPRTGTNGPSPNAPEASAGTSKQKLIPRRYSVASKRDGVGISTGIGGVAGRLDATIGRRRSAWREQR